MLKSLWHIAIFCLVRYLSVFVVLVMPNSYEDKVLIKTYGKQKRYSARKLTKKFPQKKWTRHRLDKLLKKIHETGSVKRQVGSGRPHTMTTSLQLKILLSVRKTSHSLTIQHVRLSVTLAYIGSTISRTVHKDFDMKFLKMPRAWADVREQVDMPNPLETIAALFFKCWHRFHLVHGQESVFCNYTFEHTKQPCICATENTEETCCIRTSLAWMFDVQQDHRGFRWSFKTGLHQVVFVEPGVKITGANYRDVVLMQKLQPVIRQISGNIR